MRPDQFYSLPTMRSEKWYEWGRGITDFFGIEDHELDHERAEAEEAGDVVFDEKLHFNEDGERSISYYAVLHRGSPIGFYASAGRGQQDASQMVVTDAAGFASARAYLDGFRPCPKVVEEPVDRDHKLLEGMYNHAIVDLGSEYRLVPEEDIGDDGRLVFDRKEFGQAFDAIVRPRVKISGDEFGMGLKSHRIRGLVTDALVAALPPGIRHATDFDAQAVEELTYKSHTFLILADDHSTYAMSVHGGGTGFSWVSSISPRHLGPAELFDRLSNETAPAGPSV